MSGRRITKRGAAVAACCGLGMEAVVAAENLAGGVAPAESLLPGIIPAAFLAGMTLLFDLLGGSPPR